MNRTSSTGKLDDGIFTSTDEIPSSQLKESTDIMKKENTIKLENSSRSTLSLDSVQE